MEMADHIYFLAALTLGNISLLPTEHGDRMTFRGNILSAIPPRTLCFLFVLFLCVCSLINNVFSTADYRTIASSIHVEGLNNIIETSFMVDGVRADIQMWQLPDKNQKFY
jgi:hypothetical protein